MTDLDSKIAVLIESVANLSKITANHDMLLTKLVDDHEQRLRGLEKCALTVNIVNTHESRIRSLENWKWYALGMAAVVVVILKVF